MSPNTKEVIFCFSIIPPLALLMWLNEQDFKPFKNRKKKHTSSVHFSSWLWEQMDVPNEIGSFAKLCWTDANNGCANSKFNAKEWMTHFTKKHPESKEVLADRLVNAYKEYILTVGRK